MTKQDFRTAVREKLISEGAKKISSKKFNSAISRTCGLMRREEGELNYVRSYVKSAVNFYKNER